MYQLLLGYTLIRSFDINEKAANLPGPVLCPPPEFSSTRPQIDFLCRNPASTILDNEPEEASSIRGPPRSPGWKQ